MAQSLVPCPSCSRHVLATETACPFCRAELPATLADAIVPGATQRLSRAAAFAFTASLAVTACGGSGAPGPGEADSGGAADSASDAPDDGSSVALYGAPAYGLPPPRDAGNAGDDAGDAGTIALYGMPILVDSG